MRRRLLQRERDGDWRPRAADEEARIVAFKDAAKLFDEIGFEQIRVRDGRAMSACRRNAPERQKAGLARPLCGHLSAEIRIGRGVEAAGL